MGTLESDGSSMVLLEVSGTLSPSHIDWGHSIPLHCMSTSHRVHIALVHSRITHHIMRITQHSVICAE